MGKRDEEPTKVYATVTWSAPNSRTLRPRWSLKWNALAGLLPEK